MPVTIDGSSGITSPAIDLTTTPLAVADGGTGLTTGENMFRNRIINGAMMIDQRNAGASITPTANQFSVDRWYATLSQASKYSIQQSTTVPAGFVNSILVTSLSAYSVGASEEFTVRQGIEGLNVADLGWGTANAQTVTISFWVRSSLTGTFGGSLRNQSQARSYPFTYTISAANTWEQKTVTIAGDTTGTWATDNTNGIRLAFSLGSGSSKSGTAGAWATADYTSATGATSVVGTNGATFYITGVQLEKGSTATSFDYRSYTTELNLCQRYYYKILNSGGNTRVINAYASSTTNAFGSVYFPTTMRTAPTALEQNGTAADYRIWYLATAGNLSSVATFTNASVDGATISAATTGLTAGDGVNIGFTNNNAYFAWSAEL